MFKWDEKKLNELRASGIIIEDLKEEKRSVFNNFKKCLWNAFIIFLYVFSLIGIFVESFEMPASMSVVALFTFLGALYVTLLYLRKTSFYLGYIFYFILLTFFSLALYRIINSGFSAMINIIYGAVDDVYNLTTLRNFDELYTNRYVSITACLALLSFVFEIFINMIVSRRKSTIGLVLYALPIIEMSVYLGDKLSYFYVVLLCVSIFLFLATKLQDPDQGELKRKITTFRARRKYIEYRNFKVKKTDDIIIAVVLSVVVLLANLLVFAIVPKSVYGNDSAMKEKSDEVVTQVVEYGILSLFADESGAGGMDNGKVGNLKSVTLDYETDLEVTFVPHSLDPIYIKNFTAARYVPGQRQWMGEAESFFYKASYDAIGAAISMGDDKTGSGVMKVLNVAAGNSMRMSSYYSAKDEVAWLGNAGYLQYNETFEDPFNPSKEYKEMYNLYLSHYSGYSQYYEGLMARDDGEESRDYRTFKQYIEEKLADDIEVPDALSADLERIANEIGLHGSTEKIIKQLQQYYASEFTYSLSPGKTPDSKDPIIYFLDETHKGYCVYFASSACLLLRQMGIPARYVEGYCFDMSEIEDAVILSEQDENVPNGEWYGGYSDLEFDKPIAVDVTDASAHAWVEVYSPGYGWVPVEFTLGASEEADYNQTMSFLAGLLDSGGDMIGDAVNNQGNNQTGSPIQVIGKAIKSGVTYFVQIIIILVLGFILLINGRNYYKLYLAKPQVRAGNQINDLNRRLNRLYRKSKDEEVREKATRKRTVRELTLELESINPGEPIYGEVREGYERFMFSNESCNDDLKTLKRLYLECRRKIAYKNE